MEDDLVEPRTLEVSFAAQCTNHSANSISVTSSPSCIRLEKSVRTKITVPLAARGAVALQCA